MKNKKTALVSGLSAIGLIVACSGCGVSSTNTSSSSADTKKVTITYGFYGNAIELQVYKQLVQLYEKSHPNVNIKMEYSDPAGFLAKLPTLIRSNSAPDVVNVAESWISQLNSSFQPFEDLTPYVKKDGIKESDFLNGTWTPGQLDGKLYALPNVVYGDAIAINETLFNKYHIPLPKAGWTTQDFLNDAIALQKAGGSSGIWGVSEPLDYQHTAQLFGGELFNYKTNKMEATSPKVVQSVQFQHDLMSKYKVMPSAIVTTNTIDPFLTGKAGMDMGWVSYDQSSWNSEIGNKFKWEIVPFPTGWHGVLQLNATSIMKSSPNKEADWQFVKWICTNPQALKIQGQLSSPAELSALKNWEANPPSDWKGVNLAASIATIPRSPFSYDGQVYTQVWNDFQTTLQSIQKGQPVQQALNAFQQSEQSKIASAGN